MENIQIEKEYTRKEKEEMLDFIGQIIMKNVWDLTCFEASKIINLEWADQNTMSNYKSLAMLNNIQKEEVYRLNQYLVQSTIFELLQLFSGYNQEIKFLVKNNNKFFDLERISDVMGGEITFEPGYGSWIERFAEYKLK